MKSNLHSIEIHINTTNKKLTKTINDYSFYHIAQEPNFNQNPNILQNIKKSECMIINRCVEEDSNSDYFIIGFNKTIIIIKRSLISFLNQLFSVKQGIKIYFLSNTKDIYNASITIQNQQIEISENFINEIHNFDQYIQIFQKSWPQIHEIDKYISSCITGYLICQGYSKLKQKRINFDQNLKYEKLTENDFIVLRLLGSGSSSNTELIYAIEKGELFALKKPTGNIEENSKLIEREYDNYMKINHPFLPHFYGKTQINNYLIIEYINGETLSQIEKFKLSFDEKITIIFEIMDY